MNFFLKFFYTLINIKDSKSYKILHVDKKLMKKIDIMHYK